MPGVYAQRGFQIACLVELATDNENSVNPQKMTANEYSVALGGSTSTVIALYDAWNHTAALMGLPTSRELSPSDFTQATIERLLTDNVTAAFNDVYWTVKREWYVPREDRTIQTVNRSHPKGPRRQSRRAIPAKPPAVPPSVSHADDPWPETAMRNYPTMLDYALGKARSDRAQICTLRATIRSALRVLDDPNSHDRSVEDRMHSARSILLGELDDIKGREQEERASATDPGDREYQRALRKIRQGRRHKNSSPL